jgi:isopentenyl diphosphate isomerase/L-lactate dehydrogenase-like FMN-dependent dehydrogenase
VRPDPRHRHRRRADAHHVAGIVALQVDVADRVGAREARDFRDEAEAPRLAAELAVGDQLQPEALLPADRLDDRRVLERRPLLRLEQLARRSRLPMCSARNGEDSSVDEQRHGEVR